MSTDADSQYADYSPPQQGAGGFHCPNCGVYSRQVWYGSATLHETDKNAGYAHQERRMAFGRCDRCADLTIWREGRMIYPLLSTAPRPHRDTPAQILSDYEEARAVLPTSPRAAAALLRLATEKLALHLVGLTQSAPGKDLNDNIGILVRAGLPRSIQQALDSLRVIGNEAVHPGQLDLKDDADTAQRLFKLLNIIVENRITEPREIESLYSGKLPESKRQQIDKRDSST